MRWDNIGPPSDLAFAGAALLLVPLNGHLAPAATTPTVPVGESEKNAQQSARAMKPRKRVLTPRTPAPLDTSPSPSSHTPKAKADLQRVLAEAFANTAKLPVPDAEL